MILKSSGSAPREEYFAIMEMKAGSEADCLGNRWGQFNKIPGGPWFFWESAVIMRAKGEMTGGQAAND